MAKIINYYIIHTISSKSVLRLSLFPDEDILTKVIESWKGFADRLPDKDREVFIKILNDCYKYSKSINAKGVHFQQNRLIMALLLSQHKLIEWLDTIRS